MVVEEYLHEQIYEKTSLYVPLQRGIEKTCWNTLQWRGIRVLTKRNLIFLLTSIIAKLNYHTENKDQHGSSYDSYQKYAFMLKTGATKSKYIILFFKLLHSKHCEWFNKESINLTIIVLENAFVHVRDWCKASRNERSSLYWLLHPTSQRRIMLSRSSSDSKLTCRSETLARTGSSTSCVRSSWR